MRWGIRRYQNADGSYTAAGRARYGVGSSGNGYKGIKNNSNDRKGTVGKYGTIKTVSGESSNIAYQTANVLRRSSEKKKARKQKQMDLSHMSDQELRDRVNRGILEKQYAQLYGSEQTSLGRDHVANTLDIIGDTIKIAGSAASIGWVIYKVKNS